MSSSLRKLLNIDWENNQVKSIKYEKPTEKIKQEVKKQSSGFISLTNPVVTKDESHANDMETFIIIPDVHSYARAPGPYELCMESLKVLNDTYNVTKVVQLGDLLECGELSGHKPSNVYEKIPPYHVEVQWAIDDFWKRVFSSCPQAEKVHLMGNHEARLHRYLIEKFGNPNELVQGVFEGMLYTEIFEDMGIKVVPYGNENPTDGMYDLTPDLKCVHGWSTAMNAAKAHLDRTMGAKSIIFGHIHRIQSYVRCNPDNGASVGAWSFGALAKNNMFYQRGQPNEHTNGFGIVHSDGKRFNVITIPILKDGGDDVVFLPNGEVLRAHN